MTQPSITKKQQEILKYIYHFRFLNRIQIQALLKHKDYKTINLWLKDLNQKEYIHRIYSSKFGENTKPAIYYIGPNGLKFLRSKTNCPREQINKLVRQSEHSRQFIDSRIMLADICIDLMGRSDEQTKYAVTTRSGFADEKSPYHFLADTTVNLVIEKNDKSMTKYYLLEVIEPTLPLYSVRKRIKNYFDMYFSNEWEDNTDNKPFPAVMIICPTLAMMIGAKRYTKKLLNDYEGDENVKIEIQFTVEQEVRENGVTGEIWEEVT